MITFIYGENNYRIRQLLDQITNNFDNKNAIERYAGDSITSDQLPDILRGASLFTSNKLVILSDIAVNKTVWNDLAEYLESLPEELELVISEAAPDKRTRTFKLLQKLADTKQCQNLNDSQAVAWVTEQAKQLPVALTSADVRLVVDRVGVDQWQLHFALEKLAGFETINASLIQDVIEATPQASAFSLIDAALSHQPQKVQSMLAVLRVSEDAYFFFGLLASQIFQLVALAASKKLSGRVAKDLGVHPYPLQKMQSQAQKLSKSDQKTIAKVMAECDNQLKRSGVEPWLVLEQALLKLTAIKN
jgi:DNA polymerase-3 subunit delta